MTGIGSHKIFKTKFENVIKAVIKDKSDKSRIDEIEKKKG